MADHDIHQPENGAKPDFSPGSYGCHEALHMASFLCSSVDKELCEHKAIEMNPEWRDLAARARNALADLYQSIGAKHL